MATENSLLFFLMTLSMIFLLRNLHQNDSLSLMSSGPSRQLSSQSFKDKVCTNVDLDGYLATVSTKESVQFTYDMLKNSRNGENKLKTMIQNKTSISTQEAQTYGMGLLTAAVPIAVVFIFSVLSSFVYSSCLCCKCCPCNFCCSCCKKIPPIKRSDLTRPAVFAFVMGLGVIASAVAGLIFNEKFIIGYNKVQCSSASSLNDFIMGSNTTSNNKTYRFLGLSGASNQLGSIISSFNQTISSLESNFQDTQWIDNDQSQLETLIQYIYTHNQGSTVRTSDPRSPQKTSMVTPPYFKTLGPSDQSSTVTYRLEIEQETSSKVIATSLKNIKNSSNNLISSSDSVFSSLNSGKSQLNDFSTNVNDYDTKASNNTDFGEAVFSIIYYVIIAILSFAMLCALGGMLGCCCSTMCHMPKCRFCSHLSWCGLIWFSMFIFLISIILVPVSIVLMETCDIANDALSSSASMKSYIGVAIDETNYNRLEVCLFQDGDINKLFNMTSGLSSIDAVTQSFNQFNTSTLNGSLVITNESQYVNSVLNFAKDPIGDDDVFDYSNPTYVLKDLNLWSDYSVTSSNQAQHCSISQDRFVFQYSNCGDYTNHFSTTSTPNQNFTNKVCIDVADLGSSDARVISRYGVSFANCTAVSNNDVGTSVAAIYLAEVRQLYEYKNDVVANFTQLLTDYKNYDNFNTLYQSNLTLLANKTTNDLKNKINGVLSLVSDPNTGLIAGLNCTFLKRAADDIDNSLCVVFIPAFYQLIILILLCGGFAFFMSIALIRNALMVKKLLVTENGQSEPQYENPNAKYLVN